MPKIVYVSADCFTAGEAGTVVHLVADTPYASDDPVVLAHPDLFADVPPRLRDHTAIVEAATANPGERRTIRRG